MSQEIVSANENYQSLLLELKSSIRAAQVRAALSVSRELILLYHSIGRRILIAQELHGWGAKVVDRLAADLRSAFPGVSGFSRTNLLYMRAFALAYPDAEFVQQLLDDCPLPWGHHVRLLDKLKGQEQRLWYARAAVEHGWSRAVLEHQIETRMFDRQGKALTNFARTLPPPQSDLAQQVLKDPYNFDFLTLGPDAHEKHLEGGLLEHLREFLLELGTGFAFVGSQFPLTVSGTDYFLDLLFYHLRLRCYVVVDLKMRAFEPEFAGKMNFYLAAVDDLLRHATDTPTIGLLLCKTKDALTVEYALRGSTTPIGVAQWQIHEALPASLRGDLPTVEELEAELDVRLGETKQ